VLTISGIPFRYPQMEQIASIAAELWKFITRPDIGSVASLVGSLISFRVLWTVRDLRRRALFKQRAPEAIRELKKRASRLNDLMLAFDENLFEIEKEVALTRETLKDLFDKSSGQTKTTIKDAISKIKQFRDGPASGKSRDTAREIYLQILVSAQSVEYLVADLTQEP